MEMKTIRNRIVAWLGLAVLALAVFAFRQVTTQRSTNETPPALRPWQRSESESQALSKADFQSKPFASTNSLPFTRATEFTEEEKSKFTQDFKEKYRPAAERWYNAYEGRVPFKLEDFTVDKFHSRVFQNAYTFMIGETTFTIQDSKQGTSVSYLMTRKAANQINQSPGNGFVPNLTTPVSREDVIRMVKADSGVEFKPNEIIIKPTGAASALNGGAFVDILPSGKDPNNALNYVISMVFNADGMLVNYERDPAF